MDGSKVTPDNHGGSGRREKNQNIQVFVRVRPMSNQERSKHATDVVDTPGSREVVIRGCTVANITKTFTFDRAFGPKSKQTDVYNAVVAPLLNEVLLGYNCTVFAYGQTGTGKTFTMEGERSKGTNESAVAIEKDPLTGILPRALSQLFDEVRLLNVDFSVRVSFLELYNEELFDLLAPLEETKNRTLRIYEDTNRKGSVIIQGLEEIVVNNKNEVYAVLERGSQQRKTAATLMNASSSRSHTVFTITVHIKESNVEGEELVKVGKLHLVDLAGSENIGKSGAVDKRAREAGSINQSLLTLGRVISALVEKAPHVPYRESKLTRILQDSLGGKTKTSIIATISPALTNIEETLSTLDYAHRAKNIMNRPEVNQRMTTKEALTAYNEEIERLRRDLNAARTKNGIYIDEENYKLNMMQISSLTAELNDKHKSICELEATVEQQNVDLVASGMVIKELKEDVEIKNALVNDLKERCQILEEQLVKSAYRVGELEHLVKHQVDTEQKLSNEAGLLLNTTKDTVSMIDILHGRLERKTQVEKTNLKNSKRFREEFHAHTNEIAQTVKDVIDTHAIHASRLLTIIETRPSARSEVISDFQRQFADVENRLTSSQLFLSELLKEFFINFERKSNADNMLIADKCNIAKERWNELKEGILEVLRNIRVHFVNIKGDFIRLKGDIENKFGEAEAVLFDTLKNDLSVFDRTDGTLVSVRARVHELRDSVLNYTNSFVNEQEKYKNEYKKKISILTSTLQELTDMTDDYLETERKSKDEMLNAVTVSCDTNDDIVSQAIKIFRDGRDMPQQTMENRAQYRNDCVSGPTQQLEKMHAQLEDLRQSSKKIDKTLVEIGKTQDHQLSVMKGGLAKNLTSRIAEGEEFRDLMELTFKANVEDTERVRDTVEYTLQTLCSEDQKTLERLEGMTNLHCEFVSVYSENAISSIKQSSGMVDEFWDETYLLDLPTGATPGRRQFEYPTKLSATSPHERVLARYKVVRKDVQYALDECSTGEIGESCDDAPRALETVLEVQSGEEGSSSALSSAKTIPPEERLLDQLEDTENEPPVDTKTSKAMDEKTKASGELGDDKPKSSTDDGSNKRPQNVKKTEPVTGKKNKNKRKSNGNKKGVLKAPN